MSDRGTAVPTLLVEVSPSAPEDIRRPHGVRTSCPHGALERAYPRICRPHGCHTNLRRALACERTNPTIHSLVGLGLYLHQKRFGCLCPFYWTLRRGATHAALHQKPGLVSEGPVRRAVPPPQGGVFMMRLVHGHVVNGARLLTPDERRVLRSAP